MADEKSKNMNHSPSIFGSVTVSTLFTHDTTNYICRGIIADTDGVINIEMEDGTMLSNKQVFRGVNYFRCKQVTNLNGLTLDWFA